jgi:long-chain acyl-CoA synthetase
MWTRSHLDELNPYAARPWQAIYEPSQLNQTRFPLIPHMVSIFKEAVQAAAAEAALIYFDRKISYAELDASSDAFATVLAEKGFGQGDRLALYLQNTPAFVIAALAAWKLGGIVVTVNPMNTARELSLILDDSSPKALVCHDDLYRDVVRGLQRTPPVIVTTSPFDFQSRDDRRVFGSLSKEASPSNLLQLIEACKARTPTIVEPVPSDIAMLVYTSGTTGVPKGSMNTHSGAVITAESIASWMHVEFGTPVLGVAPLFHITGLVAGLALAFVRAAPLILTYRFHPNAIADAIEEHRAGVTFCAITALMAMLNENTVRAEHLKSLTKIVTGGAPMPPQVLKDFQAKFGHYIYHGYGMTETNGPVFLVPADREAPIDELTGTLSIGVPTPHTQAWIANNEGAPAPIGDQGEIIMNGPSLSVGYWNKPDETAKAMQPDGLRSGDIGFMDANGWFYLVDRKKDMINAGGYKVWPREVEDVLYTHPAVREAAVVGAPDSYRGETVRAVISLKHGQHATIDELQEFCRERMAAYKYPRIVEIVEELPKNSSGKILRRALRDAFSGGKAETTVKLG